MAAADHLNAEGGVLGRKIELVVRDDKASANEGATIVREYLGDGVNLIVGGGFTQPTLAGMGVVKDQNAVYMAVLASSYPVTHEAFNSQTFRLYPSAWPVYQAEAQIMARKLPDVTVWGGVYPDLETGRSAADAFNKGLGASYKRFAKRDVEILPPIFAKFGTTDYKAQLAPLLASPIQGLFSGMAGADMVTLVGQARSLGLMQKVKGFADVGLEVFAARALKQNLPPNFWSPSGWDPEAFRSVPVSNAWHKAYIARTKQDIPTGYGVKPAMGLYLFADAAKSAGSLEPKTVAATLESREFETLIGKFTFRRQDHQGICALLFSKYEGSDREPFWKRTGFEIVPYEEVLALTEPATPGQPFVSS
jgi:branched-chain amino acid transport system substrate-binding protein